MYLCPRARYAFHLSSLQPEHLYTPYSLSLPFSFPPSPSSSLFSLFLALLRLPPSLPTLVIFFRSLWSLSFSLRFIPLQCFAFLAFRSHPCHFSSSSLSSLCTAFSSFFSRTHRHEHPAKIHRDFNTFNFFVIRFASTATPRRVRCSIRTSSPSSRPSVSSGRRCPEERNLTDDAFVAYPAQVPRL